MYADSTCKGLAKKRCFSFNSEDGNCSSGRNRMFKILIGNSVISLLLFFFWMLYLIQEIKSNNEESHCDQFILKTLFFEKSKLKNKQTEIIKSRNLNEEERKILDLENINIVKNFK